MALLDDKNILYVSGEEAATQIKIRANRIGIQNQRCHIYSETSTQKTLNHCHEVKTTDLSIQYRRYTVIL